MFQLGFTFLFTFLYHIFYIFLLNEQLFRKLEKLLIFYVFHNFFT